MGLGFGMILWIDSFSDGLISVICQEAGYFLLVHRNTVIVHGAELIHIYDDTGTVDVDSHRSVDTGTVDVDVDSVDTADRN